MNKIVFLIFLFFPFNVNASPIVYGTTYALNGTVTSTNLNGNFNNVAVVVNGGLDNTNANTTSGYRFYQTVATLPSAGNQGAVYFLTSDDTLNFDTGSAFTKSVALTSPTNGGMLYYNSGWLNLPVGSNGQYLTLSGGLPIWGANVATDLSISGQTAGDIIYFNGVNWVRLAKSGTSGQVLQTGTAPSYVNALSSVLDYGTSASASTSRQATAWKLASGQVTLSGGNATISNLTFSSGTSYSCYVTRVNNSDVSQAVQIKTQLSTSLVIRDSLGSSDTVNWGCGGT